MRVIVKDVESLEQKNTGLICAAYAPVCVIVWGLSGPRGLSLPSCLMWAQMSTQLDLIGSICLQECVFVFMFVRWVTVTHHGAGEAVIWPLMCKPPAELIHTFSAASPKCLCLSSQMCKISDFFLRLRCKSFPALLMNPFVSLVLDRQLPCLMVWSHGLISRAEGF